MPNSTPTIDPSRTQVTGGSSNVFADVDLPFPELLQAKADIVRRISTALAAEKLEGSTAASRLSLSEPKLRALLRGRLDRFTVDTLVQLLDKLGKKVTLTVRDAG